LSLSESIQLLAAAVGQLDGQYNFVIDAGRAENHDIAPYAQLIADSVPSNCHLCNHSQKHTHDIFG